MMNKLLAPDHLRTNLQAIAFNVITDPVFSWWDHSSYENNEQVKYQIVVANSQNLMEAGTYLFDTGWVISDQNTGVHVTELAHILKKNTMYCWSVRIEDAFHNISNFSEPARFVVSDGKLDADGIWNKSTDSENNNGLPKLGNYVFFRSPKFRIDFSTYEEVCVKIVARGNESVLSQSVDIYCNANHVGVGSPRPHKYFHDNDDLTVYYYNTFCLKKYLNTQDNVISILATAVDPNNRAIFVEIGGYNFKGEYSVILKSDKQWLTLDGTNAFGDFGSKIRTKYFEMPLENINVADYPQNWTQVNFDDSGWDHADKRGIRVDSVENGMDSAFHSEYVQNEKPFKIPTKGKLKAYPSEGTIRRKVTISTKQIKLINFKDYVIDLGKEIIGGLNVVFNSPSDQKVIIYRGEQLEKDGHVKHHLAAGPDYVEMWTLVKGSNTFNTIQMKNFRYLEIIGLEGTIKKNSICGWAVEQPFDDAESDFTSDNELLNREYEFSKYTIKATNQDVYVDSQARERRPYEGDLLVNARTSYVVSSNYSLPRYSIDYLLDNQTWPEDYKLFNVEMAWLDFLYTGDESLLKDRYETFKIKLLRGKKKTNNLAASWRTGKLEDNFNEQVGLVVNDGIVDWPPVEQDGYVEGYYNTPFNAIYCGVYNIMSSIAQILNNEEECNFYKQRADRVKKAMINYLFNSTTGKFYDSLNQDLTPNRHYSHHATTYALCYGIYESSKMKSDMSQYVFNSGNFIGSIYFSYFILQSLIVAGNGDYAIRLLSNTDNSENKKTFSAILDKVKATVAPEAWSEYYKPNMTLSHPWGAVPGFAIVQALTGIEPLQPGFKSFLIRLQDNEINTFKVKVPSARGIIAVEKKTINNIYKIHLSVPMNTQARFVISSNIIVDTLRVDDSRTYEEENGVIIVKSGEHIIEYSHNESTVETKE